MVNTARIVDTAMYFVVSVLDHYELHNSSVTQTSSNAEVSEARQLLSSRKRIINARTQYVSTFWE